MITADMVQPDWIGLAGVLIGGLLLFFFVLRRRRDGGRLALRPLPSFRQLLYQRGLAVETDRRLGITLGRGPLTSRAAPASVAALITFDFLARESATSALFPVVTVGDGTVTPAALAILRRAYEEAERPGAISATGVQFITSEDHPFAYAAGVNYTIHRNELASQIAVGRLGTEVPVITEAAARRRIHPIVGTTDLTGLALAAAATEHLLIGEEFLAAGAYLEGRAEQVASLQVQDVLRWVIAAALVVLALVQPFI